jgi:hypothetical protein
LNSLFNAFLDDIDVVKSTPILWPAAETFYSPSRTLALARQVQSNAYYADGFGVTVGGSRLRKRLESFTFLLGDRGLVS